MQNRVPTHTLSFVFESGLEGLASPELNVLLNLASESALYHLAATCLPTSSPQGQLGLAIDQFDAPSAECPPTYT